MSGWSLVEDRYIPSLAGWKESIFTIGNGYLATRGAFEEFTRSELRGSFINGLFVTQPGSLPTLGALPDWTGVQVGIDGTRFSLDEHRPAGYRRELDFTSGLLTRQVLWRGPETGTVRLSFRRLLPMSDRHTAALEIMIEALTDPVRVELETGLDSTVGSPLHPAWTPVELHQVTGDTFEASYRSVDRRHLLSSSCRLQTAADFRLLDEIAHPRFRVDARIQVGEPLVVTKYVTYHADRDLSPSPSLPSGQFDDLVESSRVAWSHRWHTSDIQIDGDPETEHAARFAAFHLIAATSPDDPGAGTGAKLMSGFGYNHHVFWDTDLFITPYFTLTQPDLARTHLEYRYRGLDGARRKAARYGRRGAFYAWESADSGDEVTPDWTKPVSGDPVRIWTGEIEEHITADVAWVSDHYWRWTGDDAFLAERGVEMMVEGGRYWESRIEHEADGSHIRDVIGPDEYHIHVDDNFYTNLLAAWQMRRAAEAIRWLGAREPDRLARLFVTHGWEQRLPDLLDRAAETMALRRRGDVWEQHAGFFDLEVIDLARFEPRVHAVYDLLGEDRMQRTAVIKQADVLMALALLPEESDAVHTAAANWEYYEPKADHGSSLSLSFHALLAARMSDPDLAYSLLRRAAAIDLDDSMGNGGDGIHAACQGGILQALIFGFAGLGLSGSEPVLNPVLPAHWRSVSFRFWHRGTLHEREVTR